MQTIHGQRLKLLFCIDQMKIYFFRKQSKRLLADCTKAYIFWDGKHIFTLLKINGTKFTGKKE